MSWSEYIGICPIQVWKQANYDLQSAERFELNFAEGIIYMINIQLRRPRDELIDCYSLSLTHNHEN